MRTTMSLKDDVLHKVKQYAESHSVSMSEAATELIERGLSRPAPTHMVNGLRVFSAPADGRRVTSEWVRELDSEQDLEQAIAFARGHKQS